MVRDVARCDCALLEKCCHALHDRFEIQRATFNSKRWITIVMSRRRRRFERRCGQDRMNQLYYGDNWQALREHVADGAVDLIYLGAIAENRSLIMLDISPRR